MRDVKIPNWLSGLPLAPEFHPTDTEFADPIAYISKIEKEASAFGICKVIPPLPKPTKKFVISNLNKSLSKCPELGSDVNLDNFKGKRINGGEVKAVFTTRQQELGQNGKRTKGVQKQSQPIHKQVWQSGEVYTLEQFESKAKIFARSQLGLIKQVSALVIEALFWKAASEKPIYVEYANDVPGSGFGEPNGSAQYCRNTSMRTQNKNTEEGSEIKKELRGTVTESGCVTNNYNPSTMVNTSSNISSARSSRENYTGRGNDTECTSGQKLSNSPWNLQVIAQSSGSLTRFMADNIPGVTSPMVYIGMLFSWFAWHVEDHELHSLNYLHTGSQKTWYAVPADYASTFEEVIRNQAYGGDIDRLAALTLLGEKTTLLSPEVIVASGIPCCRLVQNPGEFVITFPRAYHVGFSHGFNCGEAANFGTPQWLTLAKEAAVRRAAMNHLPMLSHQQLLYLSTMSFISRVPRSLMPGVRCSRLRDRQKEERELLVKKAFVEDIIDENNRLTSLLQKKSSYHAVLWDMEMLQPSRKESDLVNSTIDMTRPKEVILSETDHKVELSNQNLFMEYMDGAYLSSEFQTDSGALPCVACGLLGFPFMSVVQPSKEGFAGILSTHSVESSSSLFLDCMVDVSVSDGMKRRDITGGEINLTKYCVQPSRNTRSYSDIEDEVIKASSKLVLKPAGAFSFLKDLPRSSLYDLNDSPNTYLRPRIFCLEHAIQVEELLCGKGGADVLVICHSDFKKIKLHAAAVAEEIGSPFSYKELLLDNASPEDLKLINFAIDDEGQDQCREDWTSSVKINLQHCLKVFQKFPSEGLQHALTLRGLSFEKLPSESYECFKWKSTKSRSKRKLNQSGIESSESTLITKDETVGSISNVPLAKSKQVKLLHYVRRFKSKNSGSVRASQICEDTQKLPLPIACVDLDKNGHEKIGDDVSINENTGAHSDPSPLDSPEPSDLQEENKCISETRDIREISVLPLVKLDLLSAKPLTQDATLEIGDNISKESNMKDKECGSTAFNIQIQQGIKLAAGNISKKNGKCVETSAKSPEFSGLTAACQTTKNVEVERENQMTEELCSHVNRDLAIVGDNVGLHDIQESRDASLEDVSYPTMSNDSATDITKVESLCDQQIEKPLAEVNIGDDGCPNLECVVQPLCAASLVNRTPSNKSCPASIEESQDVPTKSSAVEIMDGNEEISMQDMRESQINKSTNGSREDNAAALANHAPLNKSYAASVEEIRDFPSISSAAEKMDSNKEITSVRDMPELDRNNSKAQPSSTVKKIRKRKREADLLAEDGSVFDGFIRSPCEGLRPRASNTVLEDKPVTKKTSDSQQQLSRSKNKTDNKKASYKCDVDGCKLSFKTKEELRLHKRNQCPHEGCGKKFTSHKNAVLHFRVHDDDRPLKCPWEGCTKSFKWAWARTEHIRVHTGEKPYKCKVKGCGLAFRFVSDYSRHRRKTGHYVT